jgi:hypothetical protein
MPATSPASAAPVHDYILSAAPPFSLCVIHPPAPEPAQGGGTTRLARSCSVRGHVDLGSRQGTAREVTGGRRS